MNIHIESLTDQNAGDLVQPAEDRYTEFFPVPHDDETANNLLVRAVNLREERSGDILNGYDLDQDKLYVGSGEIWHYRGEISFGYWIVSALRHHGYGKAFRTKLDERAQEMFPDAHTMVARIHFRNRASIKIAEALGYEETGMASHGFLAEYRKQL